MDYSQSNNKTTDCEDNPQLIVFARWFDSEGAKQYILALGNLGASTRAKDIFFLIRRAVRETRFEFGKVNWGLYGQCSYNFRNKKLV